MNQKTMISTMLMAALTIAIVSAGMIANVNAASGTATVVIKSNRAWSGSIMDSGFDSATRDGSGDDSIPIDCSQSMKTYSLAIQKQDEYEQMPGYLIISVVQDGVTLDSGSTNAMYGMVTLAGNCN